MYAVGQITLMFLHIYSFELLEELSGYEEFFVDLGKDLLYDHLSIRGFYKPDEKISYDQFSEAYESALVINAEAEALGFQSLSWASKAIPQKVRDGRDPRMLLYVPYIKGNSEL